MEVKNLFYPISMNLHLRMRLLRMSILHTPQKCHTDEHNYLNNNIVPV